MTLRSKSECSMVYLAREQEVFLLAGGKMQKKRSLGASPSRVHFRIELEKEERSFLR